MTRTRNGTEPRLLSSQCFLHRRRPLDPGETLPVKVDLLGQIIALGEEAKRLRAQAIVEPGQAADEEDEEG